VKLVLPPEGKNVPKVRVFKYRFQRRIPGSKTEEIAAGRAKLHKQKLYNL
jgi:hypothetical protein